MAKQSSISLVSIALLALFVCLSAQTVSGSTWTYAPTQIPTSSALRITGVFRIFIGRATNLDLLIHNQSQNLISILWDECALVLPNGSSQRVIHRGVRLVDRAALQAPTAIAPNSVTEESVWPSGFISTGKYSSTQSIDLPNQGIIRLYVTYQDAQGKHTDEWGWRFTEQVAERVAQSATPSRYTWMYWVVGLLVLSAIGMGLKAQGY